MLCFINQEVFNVVLSDPYISFMCLLSIVIVAKKKENNKIEIAMDRTVA